MRAHQSAGAEANPKSLFPRHAAVRIVVTAESLDRRSESGRLVGTGMLEDSREAVSGSTIDRTLCSAELTAILLGPGNVPFESSITRRLFDTRQRRALAVRDGGCMFPGCDRPVSWTEAHHINPWSISHKTEVIDGILLCRHHHMLATAAENCSAPRGPALVRPASASARNAESWPGLAWPAKVRRSHPIILV